MLEYMVTGRKPDIPDNDISSIDKIVNSVKSKTEVTKTYMRQWEIEIAMKREAKAEGKAEGKAEAAMVMINTIRELGAEDELIRSKLKDDLKLSDEMIDELFEKADHKDNTLAEIK